MNLPTRVNLLDQMQHSWIGQDVCVHWNLEQRNQQLSGAIFLLGPQEGIQGQIEFLSM